MRVVEMTVIDFKAAKKWAKFPKDIQELFINNVYCSNCGVTTITQYTLNDNKLGVLLKGKCKKCGNNVARVVEEE
jgi:hypothetical protein